MSVLTLDDPDDVTAERGNVHLGRGYTKITSITRREFDEFMRVLDTVEKEALRTDERHILEWCAQERIRMVELLEYPIMAFIRSVIYLRFLRQTDKENEDRGGKAVRVNPAME